MLYVVVSVSCCFSYAVLCWFRLLYACSLIFNVLKWSISLQVRFSIVQCGYGIT